MSDQRITSYAEFWPYYLREHSSPSCRALHYIGTTLALACLAILIFTGNAWAILGALIGGYGFAWVGRFMIEKNLPATFTYPFWSLYSDFRMYFLFLSGRIARQLEIARIEKGDLHPSKQ